MKSTRYYDANSERLSQRYDALDPEDLNRPWRSILERPPGMACDIGAGSGRDARWLATRGWEVVAVEPSAAMRRLGEERSASHAITWLDDHLPGLEALRRIGHRFDLILLSAVWQHLHPDEGARALRVLSELLRPGGHLVITLRHGRDDAENRERGFYPVAADEIHRQAQRRALVPVLQTMQRDLERDDLDWETLAFTLPDDGSGSLALLRHIIVNDNKSSSYKLALLRALARIAETLPGAVMRRDEDSVEIPLGLVGLLWLKLYRPLILQHNLPVGTARGIGFAGEDFYRLADWSDFDLHVGSALSPQNSAILAGALRDACATIVQMPTRYITWPGQNRQIFEGLRQPVRRTATAQRIDMAFLSRFGSYRIPAAVWRTLGEYASWIEPVIVREWSDLIGRWSVSDYRRVPGEIFAWEERQRFTGIARHRMDGLAQDGAAVRCVWSGTRSRTLQIDHCFPWARWPNNDLWNLVPAAATVNRAKSDRLPSVSMFHRAETQMLDWWQRGYLESPLRQRFFDEAELALPLVGELRGEGDLASVFHAMLHQRARLKANQQLVDWEL